MLCEHLEIEHCCHLMSLACTTTHKLPKRIINVIRKIVIACSDDNLRPAQI